MQDFMMNMNLPLKMRYLLWCSDMAFDEDLEFLFREDDFQESIDLQSEKLSIIAGTVDVESILSIDPSFALNVYDITTNCVAHVINQMKNLESLETDVNDEIYQMKNDKIRLATLGMTDIRVCDLSFLCSLQALYLYLEDSVLTLETINDFVLLAPNLSVLKITLTRKIDVYNRLVLMEGEHWNKIQLLSLTDDRTSNTTCSSSFFNFIAVQLRYLCKDVSAFRIDSHFHSLQEYGHNTAFAVSDENIIYYEVNVHAEDFEKLRASYSKHPCVFIVHLSNFPRTSEEGKRMLNAERMKLIQCWKLVSFFVAFYRANYGHPFVNSGLHIVHELKKFIGNLAYTRKFMNDYLCSFNSDLVPFNFGIYAKTSQLFG